MSMSANQFGNLFSITTFGEAHGAGIGVLIDGCPSDFPVDLGAIQAQLDRRRTGRSPLTSQRQEADQLQVLGGIFEGRTIGAPIVFWCQNQSANPAQYSPTRQVFRPG